MRIWNSQFGMAIVLAALCLMLCACGDRQAQKKSEPQKPKNQEPWDVVCDNAGHYTFVFKGGSLWDLQEWDNYDAALAYSLKIKRQVEWRKEHGADAAADPRVEELRKRINARKWQKCPQPESSK